MTNRRLCVSVSVFALVLLLLALIGSPSEVDLDNPDDADPEGHYCWTQPDSHACVSCCEMASPDGDALQQCFDGCLALPDPSPTYSDNMYDHAEFVSCAMEMLDPGGICVDFSTPDCFEQTFLPDETIFAACASAEDSMLAEGDPKKINLFGFIGNARATVEAAAAAKRRAEEIKAEASALAGALFPGGPEGNEQDAFRHIFGVALLYQETPDNLRAIVFAALNGREDPNTPSGMMDLANNGIGWGIGSSTVGGPNSIYEAALAALNELEGEARINSSDPTMAAKVDYWLAHLDEFCAKIKARYPAIVCPVAPPASTSSSSSSTSTSSVVSSSGSSSNTSSTSASATSVSSTGFSSASAGSGYSYSSAAWSPSTSATSSTSGSLASSGYSYSSSGSNGYSN